MRRWVTAFVVGLMLAVSASPVATAQFGQPDIVQEHWYHSYATLTLDLSEWADDYPEIVNLFSIGKTELGREIWMLQISDWSIETKPDGTTKDVAYIDGGHHGNEHLGTELAFLVAEYYIEGWINEEQEVIDVLTNTELHILIMLNADGNDFDTRWNVNQVDLNRNYDHYWNTCPTTQPGSSAFSESETLANSIYMNDVVPHADLYITMHTGVWIMLYPWGKWPDQPSDWEMYHFIKDEINTNISDIPIRNANQGLYPNCGTSRDYGYGVMGYPTFTFETDDEQFLLGTVEALSDRLEEELDVMRYLIQNIWFWRARLVVEEIEINGGEVKAHIVNLGHASTSNATLQYISSNGDLLWNSSSFGVNATNETNVAFDSEGLAIVDGGSWSISYQKRVIDASMWVDEVVDEDVVDWSGKDSGGFLPTPSVLVLFTAFALAAIGGRNSRLEL
ncbi:MAG: M14 family metallopeptidase [Candidatus Thalassarchaeaceae archaeon]